MTTTRSSTCTSCGMVYERSENQIKNHYHACAPCRAEYTRRYARKRSLRRRMCDAVEDPKFNRISHKLWAKVEQVGYVYIPSERITKLNKEQAAHGAESAVSGWECRRAAPVGLLRSREGA